MLIVSLCSGTTSIVARVKTFLPGDFRAVYTKHTEIS